LPRYDASKFWVAQPSSLSADGQYVFGNSVTRAPMYQSPGVRWSASGSSPILNMSWYTNSAQLNGASYDGSVVVGSSSDDIIINGIATGYRAQIWTITPDQRVVAETVNYNSTLYSDTTLNAVSYDGKFIGGSVQGIGDGDPNVPTVWQRQANGSLQQTMLPLMNVGVIHPDGVQADNGLNYVYGVSGDGKVAVGVNGSEAFRWTATGGNEHLGFLPANYYPGSTAGYNSEAHATTPNGGVTVGESDVYDFDGPGSLATEAVRWIRNPDGTHTIQSLGNIFALTRDAVDPNTGDIYTVSYHSSSARAVSADGNTIVGQTSYNGDPGLYRVTSFIWTPAAGMQDMNYVLRGLGLKLGNSTVINAPAISADGRTITVELSDSPEANFNGILKINSGKAAVITLPGPGVGGWYKDGDGSWGSVSNWSTGNTPVAARNTAIFSSVITANRTVTLSGSTTVGNIKFDSPVTGTSFQLYEVSTTFQGSYTVAGTDTLTLSSGVAGTRATIEVLQGNHFITAPVALAGGVVASPADGTSLRLSGGLQGAGGVTVAGTGTGQLVLAGASTYGGATTVNGGILRFAARTALYNASTASWTTNNLVINPGGVAAFNVGGSGEFTSSDLNTLLALGTSSGGFGPGSAVGFDTTSGNFTYSTAIANPNGGANALGMYKLGANNLTLSGASSFTGGTTIVAGSITLGNVSALGSTSGPVNLLGGSLFLNNLSPTIGNLTGVTGTVVRNSGTTAGTANLTINQTGSTTFAGNLTNGATAGVLLSLTKSGGGTLTLSGTNNYSGATTINAGTLQFARRNSLYNAATANWTASNLIVQSGATATFNVGGTGEFTTTDFTSLVALGTSTGGFRSGSSIGIGVNSGSVTYSSSIANPNAGANALGLTKAGAGRLILSGANTYTGPTLATGGILQFNTRSSLYNAVTNSWTAANVTVQSGATAAFKVGGSGEFTLSDVQSLAGLTGASTGFRPGSAIGIDTSSVATFTYTGGLSNAGSNARGLTKLGSGTLSLPSSSYSGNTTVLGGALLSTAPLRTPTGTIAVSGTTSSAILSPTSSTSSYTFAGEFDSISLGSNGQNGVSKLIVAQTNRGTNKASVLVTNSITIANNTSPAEFSGFLDLGNNDMIIRTGGFTAYSQVREMVLNWYGNVIGSYKSATGKGWYGATSLGLQPNSYQPGVYAGIGSSAASVLPDSPYAAAPYTTLAVFLNDAGGGVPYFASYDGVPNLTSSSIIIKYSSMADLNLDGVVDGRDFKRMMEGTTLGLTGWEWGDVNYSGGAADNADLAIFTAAYSWYTGQSTPPTYGSGQESDGAAAAIPEPTGVLGALPAVAFIAGRRRRQR
jgi:autotransporter-associated beta strand protein